MSDFPRGSEWRQWDLHFHTPSSYDYGDKSISNQEIIDYLFASNVKCVAITDHHIIDVERIKDLQEKGKDKVTILPGIELRSTLGGTESIHFIGIFSEKSNIETIWNELYVLSTINEQKSKGKNDDQIFCNLEDCSYIIHKLGGLVSIHAGKKSNTLENISNALSDKQALKEHIVDIIDIFEIGRKEDEDNYKLKVFPNINKRPPLILCSDNHNIKVYERKEKLWIKADPTFEGLKQIIFEPTERVFIGDEPPHFKRTDNTRTKYINSLTINKNSNAVTKNFTENWFDNIDINLNSQLVAIIGNKGSGKSALADIVALLGSSKVEEDFFAFLHKSKFREKPTNKSQYFNGKIEWADGSFNDRPLNEVVEETEIEVVKYIPQNYLEQLCNKLSDPEKRSDFENELKKVIFSHVPRNELFGATSLEELEKIKVGSIERQIVSIQNKLSILNKNVTELEQKKDENYKIKITNTLKEKDKEKLDLEKNEPIILPKPQQLDENLQSKIDALKIEIENITKIQSNDAKSKTLLEGNLIKVENISRNIDSLEDTYTNSLKSIEQDSKDLGLDLSEIISLKIDKDVILNLKTKYQDEILLLDNKWNMVDGSSLNEFKIKEKELQELTVTLGEPQRNFEDSAKKHSEWKKILENVIGEKNTSGSIKNLENELNYIDNILPNELSDAYKERDTILLEIIEKKFEIISEFKKIYSPLQEFIDEFKIQHSEYEIEFDVKLQLKAFEKTFFEYVSQKGGYFKKLDDGRKALTQIIDKYDLSISKDIVSFVNEVVSKLLENNISNQFKDNKSLLEFYEFIFKIDYIQPLYEIKLGNRPISQLSPGEKGTLLLIFYLFIDKNEYPLIIDQPEENLDNQSVYELLVKCIKIAKNRRQIIIVTHNPNIAVVCDAEQIIYTKIENKGKTNDVKIISGSIENPEINEKIIQILEGTQPAFDNRKFKYTLGKS